MFYKYLTALDNDILNDYYSSCTILSYENDLELYVEILNAMIMIFEEREEYEKCLKLKSKKEESLIIMINNKIT
jgi:hypothetical protein